MHLSFTSRFLPQFDDELGAHGNTLDLSDNNLGLRELLLKAIFCHIPARVLCLKLNGNDLSHIPTSILASALEGLSKKEEPLRSSNPLFLKELHLKELHIDNNNFSHLSKADLQILFKAIPEEVEILSFKYNGLSKELLLETCKILPSSVMLILIDDNTIIKRFAGIFKLVHHKAEQKVISPIIASRKTISDLPSPVPSSLPYNNPTLALRSSEMRRPIDPPSPLTIDPSLSLTTNIPGSPSPSAPILRLKPAFTFGRHSISQQPFSNSSPPTSSPGSSSQSPSSRPPFGRRSGRSVTKADSPVSESIGLKTPLSSSPHALLAYTPTRAVNEIVLDALINLQKL